MPDREHRPELRHRNWYRAMQATRDGRLFVVYAVISFVLLMLAALPFLAGGIPVNVTTTVTFGLPIVLGAISGLAVKNSRALSVFGIVWVAIGCLVGVMLVQNLIGGFCALIYALAAWPPGFATGLMVMWWRRWRQHPDGGWGKIDLGVFALLMLLPWGLCAGDAISPPRHGVERLLVTRDIAAPLAVVWQQGLDGAASRSPLWTAMAAPLPIAVSGAAARVGDIKTIHYGKGLLRVRVVAIEPGRRLVAVVLAQTIEQNALRLHTVEVACRSLGADRTRAELSITFEPLLSPRWYWRHFEAVFGGVAFAAVLDDWQRGAEAAGAAQPARLSRRGAGASSSAPRGGAPAGGPRRRGRDGRPREPRARPSRGSDVPLRAGARAATPV